ncbi:MAG: RluA family pseudouridine synthase [Pseudomonadota bacterium]
MEHSFTVKEKEAGQRIDKFLCSKLPRFSRKQIKGLIDSGCVRVNSKRVVIAGWELEDADHLEVKTTQRSESIEKRLERRKDNNKERVERGPGTHEDRKQAGRLKVYYEDRDIIVVEKPAGLLSVPDHDKHNKDSLQKHIKAYLRRRFRQSKSSFVAPLHRLDAETSGIMVFALSKTGQQLSSQFKNHSTGRTYQAIVAGQVKRENGVIDKPLEKGDFSHGRKSKPSHAMGTKRAITEYRVKERYKNATLLAVLVRTGRTHQIRAHLASEGHPIIGDSVYAEGRAVGSLGFRRHALHADSLVFKHPASGKKMSHRSPIPHDMRKLIDKLREDV